MIFVSTDSRFELKIAGYQFPGQNHDEYDDNWLLIAIFVDHPAGSWTSTDPCLVTWDVARLCDWFRGWAEERSSETEQEFIEPNLRFEFLATVPKQLRIYFELECRPHWAPNDGAGMNDLWVEFDVEPRDLIAAAESLEKQLERFPVRP